MNTNINLIQPADKEFLEHQKRIRAANIVAVAFPILVGAMSLIIFLITQAIDPVSIRKQQEEVISEISKLQDKKINLFILNNRLDNIAGFIKNRRDFSENINTLLSRMPENVIIQRLEMDDKDLTFTISSASLRAIDDLINTLIDMAEKKEIISSVVLDTLTFNENDISYSVSLKSEL